MALVGALVWAGCGTVEPGDNFVPPDVMLDEDFFFCRIQPEVITMHRCASGSSEDPAGGCHSSQSSLRLDPAAEMESVPCEEGMVAGPVPASYRNNLENVRFTVQSDPGSSPFYRRPLNRDAHPRRIFDEGSPAAMLIVEWITMGAM